MLARRPDPIFIRQGARRSRAWRLHRIVELLDLLRLEAGRETEGGEQVGVEEVVMPDDPIA